ncbi:MAG: T9SS type A sorting domain-containing protein [Chitinophagaceae bacterium]|nr:MAG: T9SS type A sorting domain-containing protein [Chitinophagaceae bacterium]
MKTYTTRSYYRIVAPLLLLLAPVLSWAQPANDLCSAAQPINQELVCTPTSGTLISATYTTMTSSCGAGVQRDVWYSFTAKSNTVYINIATATSGANLRFQILSAASCGGTETSIVCTGPSANVANLIAGTPYLVRIYSNTDVATAFTICATTVTSNTCGAAVALTPGNPGLPSEGFTFGATNDGVTSACPASTYDVWYKFVANTSNPTISLSAIGSEFTNASLELYSGTCAALTSLGCGGTSLTASNLTLGSTYLVRVYSAGGAAPVNRNNSVFQIVVNDGPTANDLCSNAELLVSNPATCGAAVTGNLKTSTASLPAEGVPAGCGDAAAGDVWYRFVAQSAYPQINLGSVGANIGNAAFGGGIRMQLFEGNCGSFSQMACATGSYNTASLAAGRTLILGNTYYIRISTLNANPGNPGTGSAYRFTICIVDPVITTTPRFGNTYVNVSKKNIGGVVEKGDTLEIRMTISLSSGVQYNPRYLDNVPTNTQMLTGPNDSIRIITNEGLTYKKYSLAGGDDAATFMAAPPAGQYNVRINMGFGAMMPPPTAPLNNGDTDPTGSQQISYSSRPVGGGRVLFATAFRVVVTGNPGDIITLGSGKFVYRNNPSAADQSVNTIPYNILITTPRSLCANATGVNNAQEFGGTFGNGTTLNRPTPLAFAPTSYTYVPAMGGATSIGDGQYGIVKSTSAREGTSRAAQANPNCVLPLVAGDMNSCFYRMFSGFWDVDGDHSGTNNSVGNIPPANGDDGGYMMLVNADYVASEIYRQTISGLCPNTYYEFSAWVRNVCPNCGVDSVGAQTFRPGVLPNLTFILDDIDQYNTGEMLPNGWNKKGFVFVTGPSQTSATFSIRNNAQGGGGNDWAMDDISIATCLPNMSYSPTLNPSVCIGNSLTINDTIRSYFNNYGHHQWQRSTNNGASWSDVGGLRSYSPVYNPSLQTYEYITSYTIPPSNTNTTDSGTLYRVIVATSASNVGTTSCQVTDGISIINLAVQDCIVLPTDLLSFSGKLASGKTILSWSTSKESTTIEFLLEKSTDGVNYTTVAKIAGKGDAATINNYSYTDPGTVNGKIYYRLVMNGQNMSRKYSRVVQLSTRPDRRFELLNVINPFQSSLHFEVSSPADSRISAQLVDIFGKTVRTMTYRVYEGINSFTLPSTDNLPAGTYVLMVTQDNQVLHRKVVKRDGQ